MALGVHTSIAGGLHLAVDRASALGCDAMQIFGRNPRSWIWSPLPPSEAALFREKRAASGIVFVAVHTNYLINLSSPDEEIFWKSVDIFKKELSIAEAIGADFLVTHLGSPRDMGDAYAVARAATALRDVAHSGLGRHTTVLLENTSGAGSGFGSRLEHIGELADGADKDGLTVGMCLDTCHAFAAGYGFGSETELKAFVQAVEKGAGPGRLRMLHLNDSKGGPGGNLDRHEHIGKGRIGSAAFALLLNHPKVRRLPMILETPKKDEGDDRRNLGAVKALLKG